MNKLLSPIIQVLDGMPCALRGEYSLAFLREYGRVLRVYDRQDSGNLCFVLEQDGRRLFIKYAGAPTLRFSGRPEDAAARLRQAAGVYEALAHPALVRLMDHHAQGEGYLCVFDWAPGRCLGRHWEETYPGTETSGPAWQRFMALDISARLACLDTIYAFHRMAAARGYGAVDFYDACVLYDFSTGCTMLCDVDHYRPVPFINTMGRMWGSSRLMAPEEFTLDAVIDEATTVHTLGALALMWLGNQDQAMQSSPALYAAARRAADVRRENRFPTVAAFTDAWDDARRNSRTLLGT